MDNFNAEKGNSTEPDAFEELQARIAASSMDTSKVSIVQTVKPASLPLDLAETNILPTTPSNEQHGVNVSDLATTLVPVTSWLGRKRVNFKQRGKIIAPATPLPSIVPPLEERHTAILERITIAPKSETQPTLKTISPELTRLIEHRTQVASQETMRVQAFVAASQAQDKAHSPAPTTQTDAEKREKSRRRLFHKRRVPVLQQISMVECGAACLAMLLSYYGRKTTISEVREQCGVGRDGLTALGIVKAARLTVAYPLLRVGSC